MRPPIRGRRRRRRSPPELLFGFSPEGRRREEAFYLSLDGNAEIEELLECDRMADVASDVGPVGAYEDMVSWVTVAPEKAGKQYL